MKINRRLSLTGAAFCFALLLSFTLPSPAQEAPVLDLNAQIAAECGRPGYGNNAGCTIELPKGDFDITETVQIGGCFSYNSRPSVTIRGQGPGGVSNIYTRWGVTSLIWKGPPGGTMIKTCGAPDFTLEDLALVMDPDEVTYGEKSDGSNMAGVGVMLSSHNKGSAPTQNPRIINVGITGSFAVNDSVGIMITGENKNDQTDEAHVTDSFVSRTGTAILQDSQQSVFGIIENNHLVAYHRSIHVRNGSITISNNCLGNRGWSGVTGYVGILMDEFRPRSPTYPRGLRSFFHNTVIQRNHFEVTEGTFIKMGAPSTFAQNIWGNNFLLGCKTPGCELMVLDSINSGSVVMLGNTIGQSGNPDQVAHIKHLGTGELAMIGNYKRPNLHNPLRITTPETMEQLPAPMGGE
jgi:hypothetical protein